MLDKLKGEGKEWMGMVGVKAICELIKGEGSYLIHGYQG